MKGTIAVRMRVRVYEMGLREGNDCDEGEREGLRNRAEKGQSEGL